jgi:hypothetical protein
MNAARRVSLFGFAGLLVFTGLVAHAQTQLSPNRVTFYTEPNFRGESLVVEAGASVGDLGRMTRPSNQPWTFAISSVKVDGAAKATVFASPNMQGDRLEITRSISDLYGEPRGQGATWDRSVASVSVVGPRPAPAAPPVRSDDPPPTIVVAPRPAPPRPPPPPVVVMKPVLRTVNLRAVDAMIHRAFREVLGRTADPEGLRTYRARIVNQGWTQDQVIKQLQRSDEARRIDATAAITQAYRDVLGREPDPEGLAHYKARWKDGWTQGRIRDDLRRSEENRNRQRR